VRHIHTPSQVGDKSLKATSMRRLRKYTQVSARAHKCKEYTQAKAKPATRGATETSPVSWPGRMPGIISVLVNARPGFSIIEIIPDAAGSSHTIVLTVVS
jgi:hypothetical protein